MEKHSKYFISSSNRNGLIAAAVLDVCEHFSCRYLFMAKKDIIIPKRKKITHC